MTDTGQKIDPASEMTIVQLETLQEATEGRFSWVFAQHSGGNYAKCTFVNYYKTTAGKRVKKKNGAYKLNARVIKTIKVI